MTKKGTEKRQQNLIYFKHGCMLNDDEEGRGKEKSNRKLLTTLQANSDMRDEINMFEKIKWEKMFLYEYKKIWLWHCRCTWYISLYWYMLAGFSWWKVRRMFSNIFFSTWLNRFGRLYSLKCWIIGPFDKLLPKTCQTVTWRLILPTKYKIYTLVSSQIPLGTFYLFLEIFLSSTFFFA